jgi:hypothetical protein
MRIAKSSGMLARQVRFSSNVSLGEFRFVCTERTPLITRLGHEPPTRGSRDYNPSSREVTPIVPPSSGWMISPIKLHQNVGTLHGDACSADFRLRSALCPSQTGCGALNRIRSPDAAQSAFAQAYNASFCPPTPIICRASSSWKRIHQVVARGTVHLFWYVSCFILSSGLPHVYAQGSIAVYCPSSPPTNNPTTRFVPLPFCRHLGADSVLESWPASITLALHPLLVVQLDSFLSLNQGSNRSLGRSHLLSVASPVSSD